MNSKNRTAIIVAAVVVVVLGLAGIAVLVSGDDDDAATTSDEPVPTYGADAEQIRPVSFTGDPLPPLESEGADDPAVGMAAPIVDGEDFDGRSITTGGTSDGPSLLVFLAHWCPHCNYEVPEIIALRNADGIPDDLDVIGISTAVDSAAPNYPPSEWLADEGWLWPTMADDANATAFGVNGGSGFPYMLLLDEDGVVLSRISGEHSADEIGVWLDANLPAEV